MEITFKNVIKNCTINNSIFYPRTAENYCIDGLVVFQFVKSTKNVWVDKMFSDKIKDKKQFETDLINHFGRVKNVYFDLEINSVQQSFYDKLNEIVNKFGGLQK